MVAKSYNVFLSALKDFTKWLLDSRATSHFMPCLKDLINPVKLDKLLNIKVANGTT